MVRVALEPEETIVNARLADPGAHVALLQPDHRAWVRGKAGPRGETEWTLSLVQNASGTLVSLEPALVTALVRAAIDAEAIPELDGWYVERVGAPLGRSRAPFQLSTYAGEKMVVAVLGVPAVNDRVAWFPDCPNEHAARLLNELSTVPAQPGWHATAIFVAPRNDALAILPNDAADPAVARAMREAVDHGVRLIGRRCQLTLAEAMLGVPIDIRT